MMNGASAGHHSLLVELGVKTDNLLFRAGSIPIETESLTLFLSTYP